MCACIRVYKGEGDGNVGGANGGTTKANQSFRIKINPNLAQVVKSRGRVEPRGLEVVETTTTTSRRQKDGGRKGANKRV